MERAREYVINDPEDLLVCPYESAHMVRAKRMAYHLIRCRLHHACTEMSRCPYNASHEVYAVELRYHMAVCEDKQRVQGKIAQERMESEGQIKGCIETPGYRPLNIWGDSWEDDTTTESIFTRGRVELKEQPKREVEPPPQEEQEVMITESEKQGLTGKQLQKLYLKKQQELKLAKEQAVQRKPEEKLRVPTQKSQSLAIHQQQQRQHQDIYQQVLQGQQERALALGRGRGLLLGANPIVPGAGRGLATNTPAQPQNIGALGSQVNGAYTGSGVYHASQKPGGRGRGWGNAASSPSPSPAPAVGAMGNRQGSGDGRRTTESVMTATDPSLRAPAGVAGQGMGRGSVLSVTLNDTADWPSVGVIGDARAVPSTGAWSKVHGLNPQGKTVGPTTVGAVGAGGSGFVSPPFFHADAMEPSQPFPSNAGNGAFNTDNSHQHDTSSSSDTEDFPNTPAWVGGGYGNDLPGFSRSDASMGGSYGNNMPSFSRSDASNGGSYGNNMPSFSRSTVSMGSHQRSPVSSRSASSTSLASNPRVVGSWADEVEKSLPMQKGVPSSDSMSSDSDFQDAPAPQTVAEATKELRKIRKKLRQIDDIDEQKRRGVKLEKDAEAKLQGRAVLIAQAASLQRKFGLA